MISHTITFWKFLSDNGIEVPIIQRDYAQGRDGKEELRKSFLRDLKAALDDNEQMKLDFVYGTTENGKLIPLDGQQRLTTLWLLHWYMAFCAQELKTEVVDRLRKFTYETRISSRQFCEHLAGFSVLPPANIDIATHIKNQRWFRRAWRNDPTIQSMLRMISGTLEDKSDGIVGVFNSLQSKDFWNKLTSIDCPIVFYHLNLSGIAHSDDLYIKMNARGKPLTSFENFKADLTGYIEKSKNRSPEWGALYNLRDGLSISIDTKWMRLFWANKSPVNTVDEAYFTFINRFFFSEVCLDNSDDGKRLVPSENENSNDSYKYLNDSRNGNDFDRRIAYTSLEPYKFHNGEIPLSALQRLRQTLDAFCDFMESCKDDKVRPNELIPKCEWDRGDREFKFFPEYTADNDPLNDNLGNEIRKVTVLTQPQRVVFFATCKFFWELKQNGEIDFNDAKRKLEMWLRVVWNLVSVHDAEGKLVIRDFGAMRTAMDFIKDLDSQNVYESLAGMTWKGDSAFDYQCKEEIQKAKKIRNDVSGSNVWEKKIIQAENHAFFQGAIRFLFTDETGNVNWEYFDTKFSNAEKYFDKDGIKEEFKVSLTKSLVLQCSRWEEQLYDQQIFNPDKSTWCWILCARAWESPIHNLLVCENLDGLVASTTLGDENANKYIKPILESLPYSTIIEKEPKGRFRWYGPLAFYRPNAHYALFTLDWGDFKRNIHLQYLIQNNDFELQTPHIIEETDQFFKGWDIRFKYKKHCFQWGADNNIYLRDEEWNPLKQGSNGDSGILKSNETEEYFRLNTKDIDDSEKVICGLENLIRKIEKK